MRLSLSSLSAFHIKAGRSDLFLLVSFCLDSSRSQDPSQRRYASCSLENIWTGLEVVSRLCLSAITPSPKSCARLTLTVSETGPTKPHPGTVPSQSEYKNGSRSHTHCFASSALKVIPYSTWRLTLSMAPWLRPWAISTVFPAM